MQVSEAIRTKRAIRRFNDEPVPEDAIHEILNAGRRSPTASNSQYLTFIAIRNKETQAKLSTTGNGTAHLGTAPLVIAIAAAPVKYAPTLVGFDEGQAATYMMLKAWDLGIGCNVARISDQAAAREALGVPEDHQLEWAISFGYPLPEQAGAPMKRGGRKPFEDVVRWDKWS